MSKVIQRLAVLCVVTGAMGVFAAPAFGAASDPLFVFPDGPKYEEEAAKIIEAGNPPPPTPYFEGPCGAAVGPDGKFYVSDYYRHAVKAYEAQLNLNSEWEIGSDAQSPDWTIKNVDPLNGPCALAFNSAGTLYVNNFHRNVTNLEAQTILPLPSEDTAHHLPTG